MFFQKLLLYLPLNLINIAMSKVSIQMIVGLLLLVMKFLRSALRVIHTIRDLMDDGQLNGSADLPNWLAEVQAALSSAIDVTNSMYASYSEGSDVEGHA